MKARAIDGLHPLVPAFRKFNRFYTRLIGTLSRGYLETPHTLQEARVIYEVAAHPGCSAKDITQSAGFAQGHLSRLVARLERAGLVRRERARDDGRAQHLFLTVAGKRAFAVLNERANAQAQALLDRLGDDQKAALGSALRTVHRLLDAGYTGLPVVVRKGRVGDLGWLFRRHAVVYKTEFGYRDSFETYVCQGLPAFLENYDAHKDRLWVAESDERPVGFVAIHHVDDRPGWAKLRWFLVEREARGKGVGWELLKRSIAFCRRAGYRGIFLWTVSDLDAARRLYERAGFLLIEETESCDWAPWAKEQRWELRFREGRT